MSRLPAPRLSPNRPHRKDWPGTLARCIAPAAICGCMFLGACQGGGPAPTGVSVTQPPAAGGAPVGSGSCVAPAVVIDAAGTPTVLASGFVPPDAGTCVPVRNPVVARPEVASLAGGYKVSLESPLGLPSVSKPGRLRLAIRGASGGQQPVVDATVRVTLRPFGESAVPIEAAVPAESGAYVLDPVAWTRAGIWLVTIDFRVGPNVERAYLAIDVAP